MVVGNFEGTSHENSNLKYLSESNPETTVGTKTPCQFFISYFRIELKITMRL